MLARFLPRLLEQWVDRVVCSIPGNARVAPYRALEACDGVGGYAVTIDGPYEFQVAETVKAGWSHIKLDLTKL